MSITFESISREHPIVLAAKAMVIAHREHDTMRPALEQVHELYPDVKESILIVLWVGINAKTREHIDQ